MSGKISRLKHKLHSTRFAKEYPRHEREDLMLHKVPSSDVEILKHVPPVEGFVYGVAAPQPCAGYAKFIDFDLGGFLPIYNQLLIYRIFRLLYGLPDIISGYVSPSNNSFFPRQWSYSFTLPHAIVGELSSRFFSRIYLSFWIPEASTKISDPEMLRAAMVKCLESLREAIEKNLHLWSEKEQLSGTPSTAIHNVPAQKYKGGELLSQEH